MVLLEYEVRTPIQVGGSIVTSLDPIMEKSARRRAVTHGAVQSLSSDSSTDSSTDSLQGEGLAPNVPGHTVCRLQCWSVTVCSHTVHLTPVSRGDSRSTLRPRTVCRCPIDSWTPLLYTQPIEELVPWV